MIVRGSREWITAEWPAPPIRSIARAASIPRAASAHAHEAEHAGTASRWPAAPRARRGRTARRARACAAGPGCSAAAASAGRVACPRASSRRSARPGSIVARTRVALVRRARARPLRSSSRAKRVGDRAPRRSAPTRSCTGSSCRTPSSRRGQRAAGRQVGRRVDQHRHVAGPDAERRVAGAVGGAHDRRPAGGDDHVDRRRRPSAPRSAGSSAPRPPAGSRPARPRSTAASGEQRGRRPRSTLRASGCGRDDDRVAGHQRQDPLK